MVPGAGLEPARPCGQGIFLPAMAFATFAMDEVCGLDFIFALPPRGWFRQRLSSLYTFLLQMKLRRYSLGDLQRAVEGSSTVRQVLQKLNVKAAGGNYKTFHKAVRHFELDTSHFTGSNLRGRKLPPRRRPLAEYLVKNSDVLSFRLKRYLIQSGTLEPVCSDCGLSTWRGQPVPLELDHRNGDNRDNELSNLRLLCPNCHAFTPTYRGKNRGRITPPKA